MDRQGNAHIKNRRKYKYVYHVGIDDAEGPLLFRKYGEVFMRHTIYETASILLAGNYGVIDLNTLGSYVCF